MFLNLMEVVKSGFTDAFTKDESSKLGESSDGISKALTAVIPAGLAGILAKATSGNDGANSILEMAKKALPANDGSPQLSSPNDSSMLPDVFGANNAGVISSAISKFAGIKDSSAASLMNSGLSSALSALGKHAGQNNLSAAGLAGFLSSQKDQILRSMPAGLSSITGLLGLGSAESVIKNVSDPIKEHAQAVIAKPGVKNWVWPLIVIVVAVLLIWSLSRGCSNTRPSTATNGADTSAFIIGTGASSLQFAAIVHESTKVSSPGQQK